jgi:hypothetical protein
LDKIAIIREKTTTKLAVLGTIAREKVVGALKAHKTHVKKDEPKTLLIEILVPRDSETRIQVYDVYENDAAFDFRLKAASLAQLRKETVCMVTDIQIERFELLE